MQESREIAGAVGKAEAEAGHPPTDARALRDALGRFATGVTIVTTRTAEDGAPIGITANSFASVSLDPPLVLWSAARASMRHQHFAAAQAFAIHVLREDQEALARHFTRDGMAFDGLDWASAEGLPVLRGVIARFECVTEATHEGGDHTIIIGRVTRFMQDPGSRPLLFTGGKFARLAPDT